MPAGVTILWDELKQEIADSSLGLLADGVKTKPNQHFFRIMSPKDGDMRVVWDCHSLDQIEEAKNMFDNLIQKGLVPYRVGVDGKSTSEVMDEFDAEAEEVIFLPVTMVAGG